MLGTYISPSSQLDRICSSTADRPIGFRNWITKPFPDSYLGIGGHAGHFLGFWAVIMQASFSFFGSEVPGIVCHALSVLPCLSSYR